MSRLTVAAIVLGVVPRTPCEVEICEAGTCTLPDHWPVREDQELVQTVILSDVTDIHEEPIRLWTPRWNRQNTVSESDMMPELSSCVMFSMRLSQAVEVGPSNGLQAWCAAWSSPMVALSPMGTDPFAFS